MHRIPHALGRRAYLSAWGEDAAFCVQHLAVSAHLLSTVYQCDGCMSYRRGGCSWLGCQVLPATGAVSILELAVDSGSSSMCQAPHVHLEMQLLIDIMDWAAISIPDLT